MSQLVQNTTTYTDRVTLFVDVLLPVPVPQYYTYRVPADWNELVIEGIRVIVQFGPKKILTGVIVRIHETPPKARQAKYLLDILDSSPVLNSIQMKMFGWMSKYYMCAEGQVLQVALPSGLKLSSQSKIQLHPDFDIDQSPYPFDETEYQLLEVLQREGAIDYSNVANIIGKKGVHKFIKSLLSKNAILLFEEVKDKYQPKREKRIRLREEYLSSKVLEDQFDILKKKPKQTEVLLRYLQHVQVLTDVNLNQDGIAKSVLLSGEISESSVKTLIKNKVLEEFQVVVSRFGGEQESVPETPMAQLTSSQLEARDAILKSFEEGDVVLFHGITGSGKTEIYIDLIKQVLSDGLQVLYLLPEIALTTQIVRRLKRIFGNAMGVYHSRFSDNERVEVWRGILEGKFSFIVGVRSSIFLPFDNLGLIIVDEEHELSYKQFDPAPRYHARDVALVLAKLHHARTLLGSATPSVESFYHANNGKYALVSLDYRFRKVSLPKYKLIDTKRESQKKRMKGLFSFEMITRLEDILDQKKQAIVFQNRRGYAPFQQCQVCGHAPQCPNCAVTLTYHMHYNQLRCHYCGYKEKMTGTCSQCESKDLKLIGYGTEKIEEDLQVLFPNARIQRMDLDTTRRKYSYQQIIDRFEKGDIDILIGTQMVSKGLDFGRVDLVVVLDIDRMMHFPDFRSHERAFHLITQVGGRAGRQTGQGEVLVHTNNVNHPLLKRICAHDYHGFYQSEIGEREHYNYPPFIRFIRLTVKGTEKDLVFHAAQEIANRLIKGLGKQRVLGPQEPIISKIRNQYLMELYIKLEKGTKGMDSVKNHLISEIHELTNAGPFRTIRIIPDVDPY